MTRALFPLLSALLILPALAGCDLVKSGDEGNLEFELVSSDRVVPFAFGTPLAAGLSADVQVYVAGGDRLPAKVNLAQPTDQTIAVVTATQEGRFTLKAKQVGTTKVEVVSAAGNDSFDLAVNALARVTLLQPGRALVPESPPVRVAQGGTARFPFTLTDSNARQLIGYGPLPVEVAPAAAAAAATTTSAGLLSVDFMEPGDVTLTPLGADPLTVTVVPVSDITRLAFARRHHRDRGGRQRRGRSDLGAHRPRDRHDHHADPLQRGSVRGPRRRGLPGHRPRRRDLRDQRDPRRPVSGHHRGGPVSDRLTHVDESGAARMVDVSDKPVSGRLARARAVIEMAPATARAIREATLSKGDALGVARIAGILAAKRTDELIPLCHPLPLDHVDVELRLEDDRVIIETVARTASRTGVEMEAMTAASVAALTIYDMAKAIDRGMRITTVELVEKSGGKSGTWRRGE